MATQIKILSDHTINQIAAGEVIENPASVIKELIENSIDAKSRNILIETTAGGMQRIFISDDGCGMSDEDAFLSLKRHATSKLIDVEDLLTIQTMGFRGEALASIASISKMRLQTAQKEGGISISVEGGVLTGSSPCFKAQGTSIEVRQLFYNVPARKKFQKSLTAINGEIYRLISSLALAHPEIGFTLVQDGKELFSASPLSLPFETLLKMRAEQLFGDSVAAAMHQIDYTKGEYHLIGLIGNVASHRHNRSGQYLYVNRRMISSLPVSYAVADGYGTRIPSERHPIFALHLFLKEYLLDINVHPQKKQVRFKEEPYLQSLVREAVSLAFQAPSFSSLPASFSFAKEEAFVDFTQPAVTFQEEFRQSELELPKNRIEPIGLYQHYLLVESKNLNGFNDGIVLIDLLAARERIIFDDLTERQANSIDRQSLMIPETITLSPMDAMLFANHLDLIAGLGFEIRLFGENSFIIDAIPSFLNVGDIEALLMKFAEYLAKEGSLRLNQKEKQRELARKAAHYAKGNKKRFMLQEALRIAEELFKSNSPSQSPYGNPILVQLDDEEITKRFNGK